MAPFGAIFVSAGQNRPQQKSRPKGAAFLLVVNTAYFEDAFFFSTVTFTSTVVGVAVSVS
jgi:hypothetical protein